MPHIIDRISAHNRATASILHTGAALHHCANPSASIQLERLYGCPVLFSGVASLVLNKKEINVLSKHHKRTLCRLQKLPSNTPDCVLLFLAGSLPAAGILHLRILSLLGMIARSSSSSILQQIGRQALLSHPCNKKSWFIQARLLCTQYHLIDPLLLMQEPMNKETWKRQCRSAVISYWEDKLRLEASQLPSLKYFRPGFMSLKETHPIWEMAENGYEVEKALTVCTMLSGRYATDYHARHWSQVNTKGYCQLCLAASHSEDSQSKPDDEIPLRIPRTSAARLPCS